MVATPGNVPGTGEDPLLKRVMALEQTVKAIGNKTLFSASIGAGGITINNGGGITLPPGGSIVDASGHTLLQADVLGGLSRPWQSVPLRPLFDDGTILSAAANRTHSGFFGPIELLQGQIVTDQLVWAGTIPELLNPKFSIYGWFGYTSNSNTITVTINFNGTTVATISSGALILPQSTASVFGPYDIHTFLGQQAINVQIYAHSTQLQGAADTLACDIQQMVLRGS
jgi:hypothetical protein